MVTKWTESTLNEKLNITANPSELEGFLRKDYSGKGNVSLDVKEGSREFIAKITTVIRGRDNEIVDPRGIDFRQFKKNPVILWAHDHIEPAIGRAVWIKRWTENAEVLGHIARGKIAEGVTKAEEVLKLMQQGVLNTVSIGFISLEGHVPTDDEIKDGANEVTGTKMKLKGVRWIHDKIVMLEFSIVNVPANPEATIEAVSKGELEISMDLMNDMGLRVPICDRITPLIKKAVPYFQTPVDGVDAGWMLSSELTQTPVESLKVMAGWFDNENAESSKSYKLIHHRSSSGHPLVWIGLAEAMGKLQTRAIAIPDHDRKAVYNHLAKHYRTDFGMEPPDFVDKAKKFDPASPIKVGGVEANQTIIAIRPIEMRAIEAHEITPSTKATDKEAIAKDVREAFEVHRLGKV